MNPNCPTVRVNHPYDQHRFMTINESDFDPAKHTLWEDPFKTLGNGGLRADWTSKLTPIPEGWRDLKWFALRVLASNFAPVPANKIEAITIIEAELARRG